MKPSELVLLMIERSGDPLILMRDINGNLPRRNPDFFKLSGAPDKTRTEMENTMTQIKAQAEQPMTEDAAKKLGMEMRYSGRNAATTVLIEALNINDGMMAAMKGLQVLEDGAANLRESISAAEAGIFSDVCLMRGPDEKPLYSNDAGRKAATAERVAADKDICKQQDALRKFERAIHQHRLELEHKRNGFSIRKAFLHGAGA